MTLFTAEVFGSMVTMPPFTKRGELGNALTGVTGLPLDVVRGPSLVFLLAMFLTLVDERIDRRLSDDRAALFEYRAVGGHNRRNGSYLDRQFVAFPFLPLYCGSFPLCVDTSAIPFSRYG